MSVECAGPPANRSAQSSLRRHQMLNDATDQWVFLAGRPPLQEYLGFISAQARDEQALDKRQLIEAWGQANDRVAELEVAEAGAADNAAIRSLPESLQRLAEKALTSAVLRAAFSSVPTTIGLVDLSTLVVFQKFINLRYVAELRDVLGTDLSPSAVFQLAVPTETVAPPPNIGRANQNTWVASSASTDLRFLGPAFLSPDQAPGYPPTGYAAGVLALGVGFGSNVLNAISIGNRLVLHNGSHRAYALYEAGVREVPCVIQTVRRAEELTVIANADIVAAVQRNLTSARPPILRDYFDDRLRTIVPVPRKFRQVRVSFSVEQIDVPAP